MKAIVLILFNILLLSVTYANDSTKILSYKSFLEIVKQYHPIAKQAGLQIDKANAGLLVARAGFDPTLQAGGANKTLDGINYYRNNSIELSIPTWYGISLQTGIEYLGGIRNNPDQTLGQSSFAGIQISLAKDLLMDKRRAALQDAKIMQQAAEQEKRKMINDLLMDATNGYWNWVQAYYILQSYNEMIEVNRKRYSFVLSAYQLGERPAIDTVEAIAQLQQFEYLQSEAWLNAQNASIALSGFLWTNQEIPFEWDNSIVPEKKMEELFNTIQFPEMNGLLEDIKKTHPELNLYALKIKSLGIEKKLKFQDLLPKLDLKYNQLGKNYNIAATTVKTLFDNNYRFGIQFSMPLRLSQGRGAYKLAKIKITETTWQQRQKEIDITNKVNSYYNQLVNYKNQVDILKRNYDNYLRLQKGEEMRLLNGESSLFLVNSRENKSLETWIKLTEQTIKLNKTVWSLEWMAGRLWRY